MYIIIVTTLNNITTSLHNVKNNRDIDDDKKTQQIL
jgi:hypothetical protein